MDPAAELLDIFDETGAHLGVAPRSKVHAEGLWHKTAQVWLLNNNGELLLQLRSPHKSCFPNRWDISSAGHIPAGSEPLESAVRELEEELGVKSAAESLQFLFKNVQPYIGENHVDREIAYVYLLSVANDIELTLQESEVTDVRWIHYTELLDQFYEMPDKFVNHELHFKKLIALIDGLRFS